MAEQRTFYDTFDWLLFAKSLILYQSGQDLTLRPLSGGGRVHCVRTSSPPAFARDLPQSSLKEQLQAVIEARALLRLADIHTRTSTYRVLNKDEKTVARLIYTDTRSSSESTAPVLAAYLSLRPVRGYAKYSRQLAKYLGPGQAISSMVGDIYRCALKATGQTPGSYSAKLDLQLDPDMRSAEAMKMILRRLLETMRANEAGIRADIDIEFLHDYRVAIRRTRSALTQIPNVFPDDITDRFKREFRLLGKGTNALRDLDVYLLAEPTYRAMLPDAMQDDIAPLFDYLRSQRAQALSDVIDVDSRLRGNDRVVLEDWAAFLNEPTSAIPAGRLRGDRLPPEPVGGD